VGLLLAAGRSRRFGADKRLQRMPGDNAAPWVVHCASLLARACDEVWVLTQTDDPAVQQALWQVQAQSPEAARWRQLGVSLSDMPALQADTVSAVAQTLQQGAVLAAPVHQGQRGHPVGFAARWQNDLMALQGDAGARALLREHADLIITVPVDDPGCLLDVDTPQAWQAWLASQR
jgi:molybdenum cofactor cytidylyltransferase